jgi:Flp pilus assembly protein TadD
MARVTHRSGDPRRLKASGPLAAVAVCLALGACAQSPKPAIAQFAENAPPAAKPEPADSRAELVKATEYWGKQFAGNPRALEPALNYAKNLKAMGEKKRALAVLQQAANFHGNSRELASEYGRLALEFDQIGLAERLLAAADDPVNPDWRVISARGTVLAKQGKFNEAIPYYERALAHAHDHPSVMSNLALAHAMNGKPDKAEAMLRQAAATDSRSAGKIRQNLALVLGLQGKYTEAKQVASVDMSAESAAENAQTLRRIVKLEPELAPMADPAPDATGSSTTAIAQAKPNPAIAHAVEAAESTPPPVRKQRQHAELKLKRLDIDPPAVAKAKEEEIDIMPINVAQWLPIEDDMTGSVAVEAPEADAP